MPKQFCVYILASGRNRTLYIGVTSKLVQRAYQHKHKITGGFTQKYNVAKLVYYELHESAESAIRREKRLKFWQREWKLELIEKMNPTWNDLYDDILGIANSHSPSSYVVEMDPAVKPQDDGIKVNP